MTAAATKQQLIAAIEQEQAQWHALLAEVGLARLEVPGVTGDWTLKDTVAHLTTWWRREIARAEAAQRGERPPDHPSQAHVQIINQWIYLTNRDRPLQAVLRDAEEAWQQFEAIVQRLPDELLFDPARFGWLEGKALGPALFDHFVKHLHEEHEPLIRSWLSQA